MRPPDNSSTYLSFITTAMLSVPKVSQFMSQEESYVMLLLKNKAFKG